MSSQNNSGCHVGSLSYSVVEQQANSLRMTYYYCYGSPFICSSVNSLKKQGVSVCEEEAGISLPKSYILQVGDGKEPRKKVLSEKEDRGGMSGASE